VHHVNKWFYYNSAGIFKILVIGNNRSNGINKDKKRYCSYDFENSILVFKIEDNAIYDPLSLLLEAQHYKEVSMLYISNA